MNRERTTIASVSMPSQYLKTDSLVIFLSGVFVFTFALTPEFIGFQTRFALFAQEMFRYGLSYFPTTYQRPYPDYPATSTFLVYLVSQFFGQVTPFAGILPTAATSALVLVLTYRIGAIRSRLWGLTAVFFALFTVTFFSMSRSISLDQYTSLAAVASFYLVYSSTCYGRYKRLWLLPIVWILGFALRGPIGLVIPVAVVCSYYLWNLKFKKLVLTGISGGSLLILCLLGLLAAAKAQGGEPLMQKVLDSQMTGRIYDRGPGFAYYWLRGFTSYSPVYPVAIIVIACHFKNILRRNNDDDNLLGGLACWIVIVLAGLSIPSVKKARYVLAVVPALSLVSSYLLIDVRPDKVLLETRKIFLRFCTLLAPGATIGVLAVFLFARWFEPHWQGHYFSTIVILVLLTIAGRGLDKTWKKQPERDMALMLVGLIAFIVLNIGIAEPIHYSLEKTKPFVEEVEALQEKKPGKVVFLKTGPDNEDIKFMVNLSRPLHPQFVTSLDELPDSLDTYYIITEKKVFRSIEPDDRKPQEPLVRGKIGHKDFVVFTRSPSQGI